jgi:hypothetical protein
MNPQAIQDCEREYSLNAQIQQSIPDTQTKEPLAAALFGGS